MARRIGVLHSGPGEAPGGGAFGTAAQVGVFKMSGKKWHVMLTIGVVRTYVSTDGKIEMTVRPNGRGAEFREFAVMGRPRQRYASETAARARLSESSRQTVR